MRRTIVFVFVLLNLSALVFLGFTALARTEEQAYHQHYPNIPGEVLLENDKVVVQKFVIEPGQWEGVHSHPGNQVYIHIRGGEWTGRLAGKQTYVDVSETGSVGWMDAIDISEQHESGNTGDTPIELLWVTLKQGGPH